MFNVSTVVDKKIDPFEKLTTSFKKPKLDRFTSKQFVESRRELG